MKRWRGARWKVEDFDEERAFHLEMETEKHISAGMNPRAARRKAVQEFGNQTRLRETYREERGWAWCDDLLADVRYGIRVLQRRRGTAFAAVAMLALCLGASSAFFAAMNSLVFEDLPYESPEHLYEISREERGNSIGSNMSLFNEYDSRGDLFEEVAYFEGKWSNIDAKGVVFRGQVLKVTEGFFDLLGGQSIEGGVGNKPGEGIAWVAESAWKNQFGEDRSLVGALVRVDGRSYTIAGVAPTSAETVVDEVSLFVGFDRDERLVDPSDALSRSEYEGTVWARIRTDRDAERVRAELEQAEALFASRATQTYREINDEGLRRIVVRPVQEARTEWASKRLVLLNVGAIAVLLIGAVNVANLLFAQTNGRAAEFWVRRMLGADTTRIVRQCLGEVAILVTIAWVVGMLVAMYGVTLLEMYSRELFRSQGGIAFSGEVWIYSIVLASICVLGLGLIVGGKAVALSRSYSSAKSGIQSTPSRDSVWLRSSLAVGQTAFTLVLIVSGGLLVKSFLNVTNQDFGFETEGIVTTRIHLSDTKYEDEVQRESYKRRLLEGLRERPDLESVALSTGVPSFGYPERLVLKYDRKIGETARRVHVNSVSPGYFETMGISLLRGRSFDDSDEFGWQTPVLVDRKFAALHYPDEEALGKRIALGGRPRNENNWSVIVGVVQQSRSDRLDSDDGLPMVYQPLKNAWSAEFSVYVKSIREPPFSLEAVREVVESIDPSLPVYRAGSLDAVMSESLVGRKGLVLLCLGMASVALLLSAMGVYGASAYRVSEKLREFAIRMAIGASQGVVIRRHVLSDLRLSLFGLLVGILLSWQLARFMELWLYRVQPLDVGLYLLSAVCLQFVYSVSSYLPSYKGVSRLDLKL